MINSITLSIAPGKEIVLHGFNYDTDSVLKINERLGPFSSDATFKYSNVRDPLAEFWDKIETICAAGCCGVGAFDIRPEQIVDAVKELDGKTLISQLEKIKQQVLASNAQIIRYDRLNESFARVSFLDLVDYLLTEIKQWV